MQLCGSSLLCLLLHLAITFQDASAQADECARERGQHCHKWAQCERRQEDPRPRCYCSPGFRGDGQNCHRDNIENQQGGQGGKCSQPGNIEHGSYRLSDGSLKSGTVITYECHGQYKLQGNDKRTCQQHGQWSGTPPQCVGTQGRTGGGRKCQRPQNLEQGTMSGGGNYGINSRVSYRCNEGLRLVGDSERTCLPSAQWSGTHPRCEKATDCEREHGKHCHRWAQCERRQEDKKPRCYCSPGYDGDGYNCHQRPRDECEKRNHHRCHKHADCVRITDKKYDCKCRDGYTGDGTFCQSKGCERPTGLTNGKLLSDQQSYVRGNVVTYQCIRGYKLMGNEQRTCGDNGRWSGTQPRCEKRQAMQPMKKTCTRPQDIQDGTLTASDWTFKTGSTVTYECRKPFKLIGNSQRTCQENGRWSGSSPTCQRPKGQKRTRKCQRPQDIPHANMQTSDWNFKPRTTVTYRCRDPYMLIGNSQITCQPNGKWSGQVPRCEGPPKKKNCEKPPRLSKGKVTTSDKQYKVGTVVTYTCFKGHKITGPSQRTCQNNGKWSGSQPRCDKIQRRPKDKCQNRCHDKADCRVENNQGKCQCRDQYFGDGFNCRACEGGQVYNNCASKCPATCDNPSPVCDKSCDQSNKCQCPQGKVLKSSSEKTCVDLTQCRK
ncbi:sushi, von Willebrand factor type A, EGF and pentraxin domain-containing protein 1-like [Styela clava]